LWSLCHHAAPKADAERARRKERPTASEQVEDVGRWLVLEVERAAARGARLGAHRERKLERSAHHVAAHRRAMRRLPKFDSNDAKNAITDVEFVRALVTCGLEALSLRPRLVRRPLPPPGPPRSKARRRARRRGKHFAFYSCPTAGSACYRYQL
jgi:hypothetical protein